MKNCSQNFCKLTSKQPLPPDNHHNYHRNKEKSLANADEIEKLKQLIKELEAKSVEQEENISELKATTESNAMNISLTNNTLQEKTDELKEWLERHDKEIEELKNKAPPPMPVPEIKGDGLDMSQLYNIFASKTPPDNTIKRIYDLENSLKELNGKVNGLDGAAERL